jgi:hypothetical protein
MENRKKSIGNGNAKKGKGAKATWIIHNIPLPPFVKGGQGGFLI